MSCPSKNMGIFTPAFQAARQITNCDSGTSAAGGMAPTLIFSTVKMRPPPAMLPGVKIL